MIGNQEISSLEFLLFTDMINHPQPTFTVAHIYTCVHYMPVNKMWNLKPFSFFSLISLWKIGIKTYRIKMDLLQAPKPFGFRHVYVQFSAQKAHRLLQWGGWSVSITICQVMVTLTDWSAPLLQWGGWSVIQHYCLVSQHYYLSSEGKAE